MIELRLAQKEEIDKAMQFIEQAKQHLKSQSINQWQSGYPDLKCIQDDIEKQNGYFLLEQDDSIGYLCIDFKGEPAYKNLKGNWKSEGSYAVVHRLAINNKNRGKGIAGICFKSVEKLCRQKSVHSIRVDTDADNQKMQHILYKSGFEYCGTIWFDNSEKIAYEKVF